MRFVFILFSLIAYNSYADDIDLDSIRSEQRNEGLFVIHQVEEQETIYSIAKRYGGSVQQIIEHNNIVANTIDIGQVIDVIVVEKTQRQPRVEMVESPGIHIVKEGETLYSISRQYDVKVKELKKWNNLKGNEISLNMSLKVSEEAKYTPNVNNIDSVKTLPMDSSEVVKEVDPLEDFEKYLVQAGETLSSIAKKIGVSLDSLRSWNQLNSNYVKIGQSLHFKEQGGNKDVTLVETKEGLYTKIDEDGFERTYEEGIASVIESMNTSKYLALHPTLPIGTNVEVRNLMNNQVVHVKVVGKLPKTGLNKNLLIRLSKAAYDQLGILDSKARVEISFYKK